MPASHRYQSRPTAARFGERAVVWLLRAACYSILLAAFIIFGTIFYKGAPTVFRAAAPFINTSFLLDSPQTLHVFEFEGKEVRMSDDDYVAFGKTHDLSNIKDETYSHSAGGIFPNIVGTVLLVTGSMTIALFLGVCSAIYLSEYARDGVFIRSIRLAIINLAGVPSIVFGLFGVALFVHYMGWKVSLMSGWFTLAFMVLPVIITASEESLRAVPKGFREGSLALGATKWQTIWRNVLPFALPGILTSSVLGIARVAGETAPIMFTAAFVSSGKLPWQVDKFSDFFFQGVMALPYHIYVVSTKIKQVEATESMRYGTAFVFLAVVMLISLTSIILRAKLRKRYQW